MSLETINRVINASYLSLSDRISFSPSFLSAKTRTWKSSLLYSLQWEFLL